MSSNWPLSLRSPHQNPVYTSPLPIHTTCPVHPILLDFINRKIFGDKYKPLNSSSCRLLHTHCNLRNTVEQENTSFPVADTFEMDNLDSLNVGRCIVDQAQAVISLFSVVTLYHSDISVSVYGPRVSTGEHT